MRIPFSQLRFPATPGPRVGRQRPARRPPQERGDRGSRWCRRTRPASPRGWPTSRASTTIGPRQAPRAPALRLGPGRVHRPAKAGDPFNDGSRFFGAAGLDLKYGVGTNMALTAAFNPDFGQVEVDPAVVNLSEYETFFEEKRPFFTEGAQIFSQLRTQRGERVHRPSTSRSRSSSTRVASGASPRGRRAATSWTAGVHHDPRRGQAHRAHRSGWTVGVLDAVTGREYARISRRGASRDRSRSSPSRTTSSDAPSATWERAASSASSDRGEPRPRRRRPRPPPREAGLRRRGGRSLLPRLAPRLGLDRGLLRRHRAGHPARHPAGSAGRAALLPAARRRLRHPRPEPRRPCPAGAAGRTSTRTPAT